jgi:hypothetical protein
MIVEALAFTEAGFPIIPVRVCRDGERWRKQPLREWDLATTNEATIKSWWSECPDALPAIPLRKTNWVVVDADRRDGIDGVAAVTNIGCLGPHSKIATPSGGLHLVFEQPNPPIHGRFKWCEGVEILGASCLLTCYDLEELKFPFVAPRAILPKMFWQPRDDVGASQKVPQDKGKSIAPCVPRDVDGLLEALRAMDPCDWRGEHDAWRDLMNACKAEGIACEDFVAWSVGDPHYAHDGRAIRREWKSLRAEHGGALWAALKARGIKVQREAKGPSLYPEVPAGRPEARIDWRLRFNGTMRWLEQNASEDDLFSASCLVAEIMAKYQRPKSSIAVMFLEKAAKQNGLWKAIGPDRVRRTIANGLRHVEEKLLKEEVME